MISIQIRKNTLSGAKCTVLFGPALFGSKLAIDEIIRGQSFIKNRKFTFI